MSDLNFELLPWQRNVMNDPTRFKVVVAGRRCGKSRLSAVMLLIKALQAPTGSGVMYIAPTQGQARVIIWKLLLELGREVIASSHVNNMEITLVNGRVIYVRGADNPDTLRGVSLYFAVLDEYADIKVGVWEEVVRASLSDCKGDALFIGTPKGRNHFYDMYQLGQEETDSQWKSWHFTTADNPLIDPDEIASAKRTMSSFSFKQEYMASFDNAGTNTFREEWLKYGMAPKGEYSTYIAIDCAGFEAVSKKKSALDRTAIAVVFVTDDGKWFVRKIEHGRWDVRETAVRILKNIRDFKPLGIGIEKGTTMNAVMPYLSDLMRKNNIFAHIQPLSNGNQNKVDRIVWALQGMFEHGRITLNRDIEWDVFLDEYLMLPTKGVHDDCFPADAPILTKRGIVPIVDVTTDDLVLTRNGYRKVLKAWCKGYKQVITRYGITATPDHRVFTENRSWVSLDSLCDDDILIAHTIKDTSCEKQLFLTGVNTTGTQTQSKATTASITHPTQNGNQTQEHSTGIYGNTITGQSLPGITSIILTGTGITTSLATLSACPAPRTKSPIEMSGVFAGSRKSSFPILQISEIQQKNGTPQTKVESGTESTPPNPLSKTTQSKNALSAQPCINRLLAAPECAALNASEFGLTTNKESVPVYDLMVDVDHEFFAYGVLVHNCIDALSLISQMAVTTYADKDDSEEYEIMDVTVGF